MAETINLRAANETPVVESISDGDKALLVDANGMAKQIDASKLGGGGTGGGTIYLQANDITMNDNGAIEGALCSCFADESLTQKLNYDTAKKMVMGGAGLYLKDDALIDNLGMPTNEFGFGLTTVMYFSTQRLIVGYAIEPSLGGIIGIQLIFDDSVEL